MMNDHKLPEPSSRRREKIQGFINGVTIGFKKLRKPLKICTSIALLMFLAYVLTFNYIIKTENYDFLLDANHFDEHEPIWRKTIAAFHENPFLDDSIVGLITLEFDFKESDPRIRVISRAGAIAFIPDYNSPEIKEGFDSESYYVCHKGFVVSKHKGNCVRIKVKVIVRYTKDGAFEHFSDDSDIASGKALRDGKLYMNCNLNYDMEGVSQGTSFSKLKQMF